MTTAEKLEELVRRKNKLEYKLKIVSQKIVLS